MGRKHKHPEHENLERWLVSYADFITLLFATFTALFAIASADLAKMEDVASAISQSFKSDTILDGIKGVIKGKSMPNDNPNPVASDKGAGQGVLDEKSLTYTEGEVEGVKQTVKSLMSDIQEINQDIHQQNRQAPPDTGESEKVRDVEVSVQSRGIKVSFDSRLLFHSGSAALKPGAQSALDKVAERLKNFSGTNQIQVEGHTDNIPISTAVYPSNWELSTARASSVVRFLVNRHGYDPAFMAASGFADSRPIGNNRTEEGRVKNRRIDIIVYSKMVSKQVDPKKQQTWEKTIQPNPKEKRGIPNVLQNQLIEQRSSVDEDKPVRIIYQKRDGSLLEPTLITPSDRTPIQVKPVEALRNKPHTKKASEKSSPSSQETQGLQQPTKPPPPPTLGIQPKTSPEKT